MSLPYRSGQAMCRKPHQESGPIRKALIQAEVTWQDTEHNTVRSVTQPNGAFGHILRPVLQHVVQEIHTTHEARVIMVRKAARTATSPKLASRMSCTTIVGDMPCQGTPPLPIRAPNKCPALHVASCTAEGGVVPCQGARKSSCTSCSAVYSGR